MTPTISVQRHIPSVEQTPSPLRSVIESLDRCSQHADSLEHISTVPKTVAVEHPTTSPNIIAYAEKLRSEVQLNLPPREGPSAPYPASGELNSLAPFAHSLDEYGAALINACHAYQKLDSYRSMLPTLADQYERAMLTERGYQSAAEVAAKQIDLGNSFKSLSEKWMGLGSILNRARLGEIQNEMAELKKLPGHSDFSNSLHNRHFHIESSDYTRADIQLRAASYENRILEALADLPAAVSHATIENASTRVTEAYQGAAKSEIIQVLLDRILIQELKVEFTKSFQYDAHYAVDRFGFSSAEEIQVTHAQIAAIQELLTLHLTDKISIGSYCTGPYGERQRQIFASLSYGTIDQVHQFVRKAEKIKEYLIVVSAAKEISASLPVGHSAHDFLQLPTNAISNFCPDFWAIASEIGSKHLAVSHADTLVAREIIGEQAKAELIIRHERKDETEAIGRSLYSFPDADTCLLAILNAFREPGYSGERPFRYGNNGAETHLGKYLLALSPQVIDELNDKKIPGLMEFIKAARNDPNSFMYKMEKVFIDDQYEYVETAAWRAAQAQVIQMCLHLLRSGNENEQFFTIGVLRAIDRDPPREVTSELGRVLRTSESEKVCVELLNYIVDLRSENNEMAGHVVIELSDPGSKAAQAIGQLRCAEQAAQMFGTFIDKPLPHDVAQAFARLFEVSEDNILNTHTGCAHITKQLNLGDTFYETSRYAKSLPKFSPLLAAFSIPDSLSRLERAFEIGYKPSGQNSAALGAVLNNIDNIEACYLKFPSLKSKEYSPTADQGNRSQVQVDPIALYLSGMQSMQMAEALATFRKEAGEFSREISQGLFRRMTEVSLHAEAPSVRTAAENTFHEFALAIDNSSRTPREKLSCYLAATQLFNLGVPVKDFNAYAAHIPQWHKSLGDEASVCLGVLKQSWPGHFADPELFLKLILELKPLLGGTITDAPTLKTVASLSTIVQRMYPGMSLRDQLKEVTSFVREFGVQYLEKTIIAWTALQAAEPLAAELATELARYGVTQQQQEGKQQLKAHVGEIRKRLLARDGTVEPQGDIDLEIISAISRNAESIWRQNAPLQTLVTQFNQEMNSGTIAPTPAYLSFGTKLIKKIDEAALQSFSFNESSSQRFLELRDDFAAVINRSSNEFLRTEFPAMLNVLEKRISELKQPLEESELAQDKDGKRSAGRIRSASQISSLIERLEQKSGSGDETTRVLQLLAESDQYSHATIATFLRRLTIVRTMEKVSNSIDFEHIAAVSIGPESLAELTAVIDDLVIAEGLPQLGLSGKGLKRIGMVFNTKALTDEQSRLGKLETRGSEEWGFHPTRGLLAELSGYLCDACWTREQQIMKKHSNKLAVIFERSPGSSNSRLGGACMLIEAVDKDGEKTLVVRGLNPLQNFITRVQSESFVEQFLNWLAPQAAAAGYKQIVIPRGPSGGSQTNRPSICTYIEEAYKDALGVLLSNEPDTTFNGYNIQDSCIVLRRLEFSINREPTT